MTEFVIKPRLTSEQTRAAARAYGWEVVPHRGGGMLAVRGAHQLTVAFNEDGSFRTASVRRGIDGMSRSLMEQEVVGQLAQHGGPPQ